MRILPHVQVTSAGRNVPHRSLRREHYGEHGIGSRDYNIRLLGRVSALGLAWHWLDARSCPRPFEWVREVAA